MCFAAQPRYPNPKTPDQIWQNDLDLHDKIESVETSISTGIVANSTFYIQNTASPTTSTQIFHVSSGTALIFNSSTGTIANLTSTNISASSGTITNARITNLAVTTETWRNFGILPILQIQSYTLNTSSDITTTAFSRTLAGSITPKLSTSKIMIIGAGNLGCSGAGVCYGTLYRDTTHLASSDGGFATNTAASNNHLTMLTYDSPATTSSTEYSIRTRVNGGGVTASLPGTDGGAYTTTATLILVEIAQ